MTDISRISDTQVIERQRALDEALRTQEEIENPALKRAAEESANPPVKQAPGYSRMHNKHNRS